MLDRRLSMDFIEQFIDMSALEQLWNGNFCRFNFVRFPVYFIRIRAVYSTCLRGGACVLARVLDLHQFLVLFLRGEQP